ncbi:MAG: YeeE/YedE family protein [Limnobacter sp.]|uniref:YeeE/YedE family protein n=1 Tax=Limnobacter sp. TaxID=2003368 RepID=UPI0022C08D5A|nr:YeeE/YedE family protein [Limnobacter sp.]MCZ8016313.1 YeeE/YedE family protein [Limnobacter sp.]
MISIHWEAFTPYSALLGGLMIGVSAVMLILLTGRVAGISGILGELIKPQSNETLWRFTFVLGMVTAPWLYMATMGSFEFESPRGPLALIVAGLLVGYGTRLGSGCTSGHGVCGLSRLSLRSLVATGVFMTVGFVVASLLMHAI